MAPGSMWTAHPVRLQQTRWRGPGASHSAGFIFSQDLQGRTWSTCTPCVSLASLTAFPRHLHHPLGQDFSSSLSTGIKILSSWDGTNDKFAMELAPPLLPHSLLSFFRFSHIPLLCSFKLSSSLHFFVSGLLLISSENSLWIINNIRCYRKLSAGGPESNLSSMSTSEFFN